MLSEEIIRMAETELQSCEIERQKPEEIKEVSSNKPLSDEDDEQIDNIGMHKKIYRKGKILKNNSDKEIQIENKQDSDASKDNSNVPAQEDKEKQDFNCVNNEDTGNNK